MSESRKGSSAVGWIFFASAMMMMAGFFQAFYGLAAVFKSSIFALQDHLFKLDISAWGWTHLAWGIILILAGYSLYSGAVWARTLGVFLAGLSAIASFLTIPQYPFWSILIITLDVFVIWALTVHGRDIAEP